MDLVRLHVPRAQLAVDAVDVAALRERGGATRLVYQLDSDGLAEWRWGDLGRAWLSVCPRHPTRPLYFWECS